MDENENKTADDDQEKIEAVIPDEQEVLIVKYGEIALRGKNRFIYENMLIESIKKNLKKIGKYWVIKEQGRFVVEGEAGKEFDFEKVLPRVTNIFGIVAVCPGVKIQNQGLEQIQKTALAHMRRFCPDPCTFKVETIRANKNYPIPSNDVSALTGAYLLENMDNLKVNVKTPEVTLKVELRNCGYIYSKVIKGLGGLPPGSSGKAVLLLSGGIDSPVAGYMAAKRGIEIKAVYFHSPPYTSERAKEKVRNLAEQLSRFAGKFELVVIPFTELQLHLVEHVPEEKITLLLKRTMLRVADKIGAAGDALALITGDSVGQVASQTLHSLKAVGSAAKLPILRPLCCMDKQEIMDRAQAIGTYDISILPYDDCCTLFLPKHPETRPKQSIIESIEADMQELDEMMDRAIGDAEIIRF